MAVLYALAVMIGIVGARATSIAGRGGILHRSIFSTATSFIGMLALFFLLIGGFWFFNWYIPVTAFLAGTILGTIAVGHNSWSIFFQLSNVADLIVIAMAASMILHLA